MTGYTARELAELRLPGIPARPHKIREAAKRLGWRYTEEPGRGGLTRFYAVEDLPLEARLELARRAAPATSRVDLDALGNDQFVRAPERLRAEALRRVEALIRVELATEAGVPLLQAYEAHATADCSARTLRRWHATVRGLPREQWAAALLPAYRSTAQRDQVDPEAWDALLSDYLRPEQPTFAACYRRLVTAARRSGWTIPSQHSLLRRLRAEVPPSVALLRRKGKKALEEALPTQRRDRSGLRALQWVNSDGFTLDVFVAWPGIKDPIRPHLIAWQDVYSGKVLAWRIDTTENADAVRLALADVLRNYGIPEHCTVDNGHAYASEEMTGQALGRHRRRATAGQEVRGIYGGLGMRPHFAIPARGRSKPIERVFRDFARDECKDPVFSGAYVGNNPTAKPENYRSRAVPLADFVQRWDELIREYNSRQGRRSTICAGRSFDEVFEDSYGDAGNVIRRATEAQIQWLLLPSKAVNVSRRESQVELLKNRYHHPELLELRGQRVVVKYDPRDLHQGVWIFKSGELEPLCFAECYAPVGHGSSEAARVSARVARAEARAVREAAKHYGTIPVSELIPQPERARCASKSVIAGRFGRGAVPPEMREQTPADELTATRRQKARQSDDLILAAGRAARERLARRAAG